MQAQPLAEGDVEVRDVPERSRFEVVVDGRVAGFAAYRWEGDAQAFTHTEVDAAYEGQGVGSRLVREVLERAAGRGTPVLAHCPFVRAYLERHPDLPVIVRPEGYDEQVLRVVAAIPAGQVLSYGDVAEYVGAGGPRQVGQVLARSTGDEPWWRVIHADGSPPPHKGSECLDRLRAEGVPLRAGGDRVDMRRARWDGGAGDGG